MGSFYNFAAMFVFLVVASSSVASAQDKQRPNILVSLGDLPGIMTGNIVVHWPTQKELETHSTITTSFPGCKVDGYTVQYEFAGMPPGERRKINGAVLKPQLKETFNNDIEGRAIISDIALVCGSEHRTIADSIILRHPEGSKELLKHFTK